MKKFILDHQLTLTNLDPATKRHLKKRLTLQNPKYREAEKAGPLSMIMWIFMWVFWKHRPRQGRQSMSGRTFKRRPFDMTFEEMKKEKVAALVEAAQDCGHYTDFEDLERNLEYVGFCKGELLFSAADEWGLRQAGETAFINALPKGSLVAPKP